MKTLNLLLALGLFAIGCASLADVDAPVSLENRSLFISKTIAGFEYPYRECVKKGLFGSCLKSEMRVDYYDLTKPEVRQRLIDMGFVGKVRDKSLQ